MSNGVRRRGRPARPASEPTILSIRIDAQAPAPECTCPRSIDPGDDLDIVAVFHATACPATRRTANQAKELIT